MDAEIFPEGGGQNHQRPKSRPFFRRTENFGVFFSRHFRPFLSAYIASAEGASEKFMHIDVQTLPDLISA